MCRFDTARIGRCGLFWQPNLIGTGPHGIPQWQGPPLSDSNPLHRDKTIRPPSRATVPEAKEPLLSHSPATFLLLRPTAHARRSIALLCEFEPHHATWRRDPRRDPGLACPSDLNRYLSGRLPPWTGSAAAIGARARPAARGGTEGGRYCVYCVATTRYVH